MGTFAVLKVSFSGIRNLKNESSQTRQLCLNQSWCPYMEHATTSHSKQRRYMPRREIHTYKVLLLYITYRGSEIHKVMVHIMKAKFDFGLYHFPFWSYIVIDMAEIRA
jgi:hypothetical protein